MDRQSFATLIRRAIKTGALAPHSILWQGKPRIILKLASDPVKDIPRLVGQLGGRACLYVLDGDTVFSLIVTESDVFPNLFLGGTKIVLKDVLEAIRYPEGSRWVMQTGGTLLQWRMIAQTPVSELQPAA